MDIIGWDKPNVASKKNGVKLCIIHLPKRLTAKPGMAAQACNLGSLRQDGQFKFETNYGCIMCSRLAWANLNNEFMNELKDHC